MRVLAWPLRCPYNVYTGALNAALARHVAVEGFEPVRTALPPLLKRKFDIWHIHWLERAFWGPADRYVVRNLAIMLLALAILKLRGTRIVWTAHDPQPHDMAGNARLRRGWTALAWKLYRRLMIARIDAVLLLSETHRAPLLAAFPRLARVPITVVPHLHFRGLYPDQITRPAAREALGLAGDEPVAVHVGNLRSYKNPDGLVRAFAAMPGDARLLLTGAPENEAMAARLRALSANDERIRYSFDFVADEALQLWLRAADLAIFPYRRVTNSGSALLALSFNVPVLVPDEPLFRELRRQAGEDWVFLYAGELTPQVIEAALDWAGRRRAGDRGAAPDLAPLDADAIAKRTLAFFAALTGPYRDGSLPAQGAGAETSVL